jgi:hypothetical protein
MGPWNDYEFVSPKGARLKQIQTAETKDIEEKEDCKTEEII